MNVNGRNIQVLFILTRKVVATYSKEPIEHHGSRTHYIGPEHISLDRNILKVTPFRDFTILFVSLDYVYNMSYTYIFELIYLMIVPSLTLIPHPIVHSPSNLLSIVSYCIPLTHSMCNTYLYYIVITHLGCWYHTWLHHSFHILIVLNFITVSIL